MSDSQLQAEYSLQPNVYCHMNLLAGPAGHWRVLLWLLFAKETHKVEFFKLDIISILSRYLFIVGAEFCIISMFSSIPGLYSVDVSSHSSASVMTFTECPLGGKIENHQCKVLRNAIQHRLYLDVYIYKNRCGHALMHINTHT